MNDGKETQHNESEERAVASAWSPERMLAFIEEEARRNRVARALEYETERLKRMEERN